MRLVWTGPARDDLYHIADEREAFEPGSALKLLRRVYDTPRILLDQPRLGSTTRKPSVRKWPVRGTPFILLYVVRRDCIEVRRVVHNRSDWQSLQP